jgi:hypothetical protein
VVEGMMYGPRWRRYFQKVRGNYDKIEWIEKDTIGSPPSKFTESSSVHLFHPLASRVYREKRNQGLIVIREYPNKYSAHYDQYHPGDNLIKHLLYDRTGEVIVGAGILASVAFGTPESKSRAEKMAQELDPREYNIFISHSWTYDGHYERIEEFLNDIDKLNWKNYSVPQEESLDVSTDEELKEALRNQIKGASVVLITSGMYSAHSDWIKEEIKIAKNMDKPIVGIKPDGNQKIPSAVKNAADEIVGWRKGSIIGAVAEHGSLE